MLKNLCELQHQVENKVCRFVCDNDTPINFIKEALFQFQKYIGQIEDAAAAQQKAQAESLMPLVEPIAPIDPDVPAPEAN